MVDKQQDSLANGLPVSLHELQTRAKDITSKEKQIESLELQMKQIKVDHVN